MQVPSAFEKAIQSVSKASRNQVFLCKYEGAPIEKNHQEIKNQFNNENVVLMSAQTLAAALNCILQGKENSNRLLDKTREAVSDLRNLSEKEGGILIVNFNEASDAECNLAAAFFDERVLWRIIDLSQTSFAALTSNRLDLLVNRFSRPGASVQVYSNQSTIGFSDADKKEFLENSEEGVARDLMQDRNKEAVSTVQSTVGFSEADKEKFVGLSEKGIARSLMQDRNHKAVAANQSTVAFSDADKKGFLENSEEGVARDLMQDRLANRRQKQEDEKVKPSKGSSPSLS